MLSIPAAMNMERIIEQTGNVSWIDRVSFDMEADPPLDPYTNANYILHFTEEATQQQQDNANAQLAAFDLSQAAIDAWLASKNPERKELREQAQSAIDQIDNFLALPDPTNAQIKQAVIGLAQNQKRIIKRLIQID